MEVGQTGMSTSFNFSVDVVLSKKEKTTRESLLSSVGRVGFFSIVKYKKSWVALIPNPKNGTLHNAIISMYFKAVH